MVAIVLMNFVDDDTDDNDADDGGCGGGGGGDDDNDDGIQKNGASRTPTAATAGTPTPSATPPPGVSPMDSQKTKILRGDEVDDDVASVTGRRMDDKLLNFFFLRSNVN